MFANLRQAHTNFDRAVRRLCRFKPFVDDGERLAMVLKMYQRLTSA